MGIDKSGQGSIVAIGKPISKWPKQNLRPHIQGKNVMILVSDGLYPITKNVFGVKDWRAREMVMHQQGLLSKVDMASVQEVIATFLRVPEFCQSAGAEHIGFVFETNELKCPALLKGTKEDRAAIRQRAIDNHDYQAALRPSDCIVQGLISQAQDLGYECHVALQHADAECFHQLYTCTADVCVVLSNDSDFTTARMPSGTVFHNLVKKRMAVKTAPVQ